MNAEAWSQHGTMYDEVFAPVTGLWAADSLKAAKLNGKAKILDVGCGTGVVALLAARAGHEVTATDYSEGMVNLTGKNMAAQRLSAELLVADGHTLEGISDSSFDAVFSCFGIFLFPRRAEAWAAAKRVLKPGGVLCATSWDADTLMARAGMAVVKRFPPPGAQPPPANTQNINTMVVGNPCGAADTFRAEVEAAGFEDVRVYTVNHDLVFPSGGAMAAGMLDNPSLKALQLPADKGPEVQRIMLEAVTGTTIAEADVTQSAVYNDVLVFNARGHICVATKPL